MAKDNTIYKERTSVGMIIYRQVSGEAVNSHLVTYMRKLAIELADEFGYEQDTAIRKHWFILCGIEEFPYGKGKD